MIIHVHVYLNHSQQDWMYTSSYCTTVFSKYILYLISVNIEELVLQISYRNVVNYIVFYCPCMIMYKAVFTVTWLS